MERVAFLTTALIKTRDVLVWLNSINRRVADQGDDIQQVGKEGDLTSLICEARNAACHIGSHLGRIEGGGSFRFGFFETGARVAGAVNAHNKIPGDLMITFANVSFYLRANLLRAVDRCEEVVRTQLPSTQAPAPDGT
jgi:hypothetical protein